MDRLSIIGGNRLQGEVTVSGMKNSALPIIFGCILIRDECVLENIPRVSDIENALAILRDMGAIADFVDSNTVLINCKDISDEISGYDKISKMRASSYLMGAMLARFGIARLPMPGGCNFAVRPIEQHIKGFSILGAKCSCNDGFVEIDGKNGVKAAKITLDKISVGATINMVLASVFSDGLTIIENPAREPHVDDLICFLNSCGAKIHRKDGKIFCFGVNKLHGTKYKILPDMIEALTYMLFVGICGGNVDIRQVNYSNIRYVCDILGKIGFIISKYDDSVNVNVCTKPYGANIVTDPYPYFPTDLHPQFASLLCFTKNGGIIEERIYPTRFQYVEELNKMGAKIIREQNKARIFPSNLHGTSLKAPDLRAGAALVSSALGAEGESIIYNVNYIVRGYENLVGKISSINGKIKLIKGE